MNESLLKFDREKDVSIVGFGVTRIVDGPELDAIRDELVRFVIAAEPPKVLLDLDGVELISSAAIALLRDLYRAIQSRQGTLGLCSVRQEIADVLRFTKIDSLFEIFPDRQAAVVIAQ
ncbi:MAG: anti-sigma factor antagonist [Planctomycetia bacterium]|nr:anti-sigma factor antagonist [Planctomycetia bacterium]